MVCGRRGAQVVVLLLEGSVDDREGRHLLPQRLRLAGHLPSYPSVAAAAQARTPPPTPLVWFIRCPPRGLLTRRSTVHSTHIVQSLTRETSACEDQPRAFCQSQPDVGAQAGAPLRRSPRARPTRSGDYPRPHESRERFTRATRALDDRGRRLTCGLRVREDSPVKEGRDFSHGNPGAIGVMDSLVRLDSPAFAPNRLVDPSR